MSLFLPKDFLYRPIGVASLLGAIDWVLDYAPSQGGESFYAPSDRNGINVNEAYPLAETLADAKMRYEMQRAWVGVLAALTREDFSEPAAVAAALLTRLAVRVRDARAKKGTQPNSIAGALGARASHLASLDHLLSLWEKGVKLPLPSSEE